MASNTAGALRQARALRLDVILVDIGLGTGGGAWLLTRDGGAVRDFAPMITISSYAEADYAELIAESPAAGFLAKSELSVQAIGRILGRTP